MHLLRQTIDASSNGASAISNSIALGEGKGNTDSGLLP
jgi:hypothetical protein